MTRRRSRQCVLTEVGVGYLGGNRVNMDCGDSCTTL